MDRSTQFGHWPFTNPTPRSRTMEFSGHTHKGETICVRQPVSPAPNPSMWYPLPSADWLSFAFDLVCWLPDQQSEPLEPACLHIHDIAASWEIGRSRAGLGRPALAAARAVKNTALTHMRSTFRLLQSRREWWMRHGSPQDLKFPRFFRLDHRPAAHFGLAGRKNGFRSRSRRRRARLGTVLFLTAALSRGQCGSRGTSGVAIFGSARDFSGSSLWCLVARQRFLAANRA